MEEVKYLQAIKRKYPEQIVMLVCADAAGKPNIITLGWTMLCSHLPPMMAVSVGHSRYSHDLIKNSGQFVIAYPSEEQTEAMIFCGTHSGRDYDKFAETGIEPLQARKIETPLIGGAVANFECRLASSVVTGDHTIFVGEVVASHEGKPGLRRVYTLGPNEFGGLG